jgi:hypothetical protein
MPTRMAHLVVILGAGASRACTPRPGDANYLPPLTADLFSQRYSPVLSHYPRAEAAAADIRVIVKSGALVIERFLREQLRESEDEYARRRYRQIPLYLQELLVVVSRNYAPHPDNIDRLVNAALALQSVVFVTLNYDTILDLRLVHQTGSISSMDDYIRDGEKWALIKLHGSVDWARSVTHPDLVQAQIDNRLIAAFDELGDELDERLDPEIHLRSIQDMQTFRYDGSIPSLYFPALSVPLGSEDELVCDPSHVEFLRQRLRDADGLNLLVIGYSGADQEVLRLLRESENSLRSLLVINQNAEGAEEAQGRILEQFEDEEAGPGASNVDFNDWAQSQELDDYFEGLE